MWNETDAARRGAVEQVWAPDARYTDPLAVAQSHDAIEVQFPAWLRNLPLRLAPTTFLDKVPAATGEEWSTPTSVVAGGQPWEPTDQEILTRGCGTCLSDAIVGTGLPSI
ncbi:MAG: hypothetical protein ACRDSZ_11100 [Pseudonocardiaceae bacterium]